MYDRLQSLAVIQRHIKKRRKETENDSKCDIHEEKDNKKKKMKKEKRERLVLHQQI